MDNYMAQTIMDAGDGARVQLDASVKRLLSVRYILARIMIHAVAEYRGCTIEQAMACIEGNPIVSRKDLRTGKVLPEVVHTASNESASSEKGHIYYDVVFYAYSPSGEHQKLWINVEGQKSNYPGYDLMTTILVNLSPDGRSEDELVGMLSVLFYGRSTASEKIRTLSEDYGFPMTADIDTEVNTMCNYSEYIVELTREEEQAKHKAEIAAKDAQMQAALADKDAQMQAQIDALKAQIDALKAQIPAV